MFHWSSVDSGRTTINWRLCHPLGLWFVSISGYCPRAPGDCLFEAADAAAAWNKPQKKTVTHWDSGFELVACHFPIKWWSCFPMQICSSAEACYVERTSKSNSGFVLFKVKENPDWWLLYCYFQACQSQRLPEHFPGCFEGLAGHWASAPGSRRARTTFSVGSTMVGRGTEAQHFVSLSLLVGGGIVESGISIQWLDNMEACTQGYDIAVQMSILFHPPQSFFLCLAIQLKSCTCQRFGQTEYPGCKKLTHMRNNTMYDGQFFTMCILYKWTYPVY